MSERESVEVSVCPRPDLPHRSHKNTARSKDKHSNSGSYGRRGHLESPPTFSCPSRHPPHHPSPRGSWSKSREREKRRGGRDRVDETSRGKLAALPAQCGGVEGEGRKKMSLNHLLNFTLSPRESGREVTRRRHHKTHSYNKEQFLQANCQFVVADRGDYSVHTTDPDRLVDWDSIELVRLFCHEIPSCPICLYPPRAAKITRCGHVYCWSCVLHYLSLGERKWRKCPICYESIHRGDLKSVMALPAPQYLAGDVITMRLMAREKGSTHILPSTQCTGPSSALPSLNAAGERFVKLLVCSAEQSLELIVQPEKVALTSQLDTLSQDEASEQCFIELALEDLKAREVSLKQSLEAEEEVDHLKDHMQVSTSTSPGSQPVSPTDQWMPRSDSYVEGGTVTAFSGSEEEEEAGGGGEAERREGENSALVEQTSPHTDSGGSLDTSMEQVPATSSKWSPSAQQGSSLVYFYQSADGQHIYLHTVNARCLVKEYGGLEFAPEEIRARIIEMDQLSMTEETRGRYKYLSHLPITCEFALCELDLQPPLVSRDTLAFFQDDLERRRHRRVRKRRDEKRRERKTTSTQKPPTTTNDAFPLPTSVYQPLSPERIHDLLPQLTSSPPLPTSTLSPPPSPCQPHLNPIAREFVPGRAWNGGQDESSTTPSFAEALRGKPPPIWPIKPSRQQVDSTGAVQPSDEEEGESVPSFKEAFTEALLTAQVSTHRGEFSKRTAKKGRKKLVLFSTGGARGTQH